MWWSGSSFDQDDIIKSESPTQYQPAVLHNWPDRSFAKIAIAIIGRGWNSRFMFIPKVLNKFCFSAARVLIEPPQMLIFFEPGLSKFSSPFDRRKRKKLRYFQRLVTPMMIWLGQKQQTLMCLHSLASDRRIYWCKDATLIMQGTSDQDAPQTSLICLLYKYIL